MATQTVFIPGKVYSLFGKNGQTMVEIESAGLKLGQVVSYSDIANPHQKAVVVNENFDGHGQQVIFLEDFHTSRVSMNDLDDSGHAGWHLEPETMTQEQVNAVIAAHTKQKQDEHQKREQARIESERLQAEGKARFDSLRPTWAKAAIIATFQIDDCDSMTDYFATKHGRSVFLGWSKHDKNRFDEMRNAALNFEETAHLGPGCDVYKPLVLLADEIVDNSCAYWKNSISHWHQDFVQDKKGQPFTFTTEAEAQAHIEKMGQPHPVSFSGTTVNFKWEISKESIEHRDNHSMGRGMVLGAGDYRTGWIIRKRSFDWGLDSLYSIFADPQNVMGLHKTPAPAQNEQTQETQEQGKIKIRFNSLGIEIEFPGIPSQEKRDKMKAAGYRWHGKNKYWYAKRNAQTEQVAQTIHI